MTIRPDWNEYFMRIATEVATRATCDRKHVGAVIVRRRCILATGYNGSMVGQPHCDDVGHLMEDSHCVRVVHAEANAIAQAAREGVRLTGAGIYVTAMPCWACFKLLVNAGVTGWIYYGEAYRPDPRVVDAARELTIPMDQISVSPLIDTSNYLQVVEERNALRKRVEELEYIIEGGSY